MQIVILASDSQRRELDHGTTDNVIWIQHEGDFLEHSSADAFLDLNYTNTSGRNNVLVKLLPKLVVINSVAETLRETNDSFVRINAWNTFLSSSVLEASANNGEVKKTTEEMFARFGKSVEWL